MADVAAMPSESLLTARTSATMQMAFVRQARKYLHERLLCVPVFAKTLIMFAYWKLTDATYTKIN